MASRESRKRSPLAPPGATEVHVRRLPHARASSLSTQLTFPPPPPQAVGEERESDGASSGSKKQRQDVRDGGWDRPGMGETGVGTQDGPTEGALPPQTPREPTAQANRSLFPLYSFRIERFERDRMNHIFDGSLRLPPYLAAKSPRGNSSRGAPRGR